MINLIHVADITPFPAFHFDSNSCWGNVRSMADLKEKYDIYNADRGNNPCTFEDFLRKAKSEWATNGGYDTTSFGMRYEHRSNLTLYDHLVNSGVIKNTDENE